MDEKENTHAILPLLYLDVLKCALAHTTVQVYKSQSSEYTFHIFNITVNRDFSEHMWVCSICTELYRIIM